MTNRTIFSRVAPTLRLLLVLALLGPWDLRLMFVECLMIHLKHNNQSPQCDIMMSLHNGALLYFTNHRLEDHTHTLSLSVYFWYNDHDETGTSLAWIHSLSNSQKTIVAF